MSHTNRRGCPRAAANESYKMDDGESKSNDALAVPSLVLGDTSVYTTPAAVRARTAPAPMSQK